MATIVVPLMIPKAAAGLWDMSFHSFGDTIGHEHIHTLQRAHTVNAFPIFESVFKNRLMHEAPLNVEDFSREAYFLKDYEVQARLHTLLAAGVRRGNALPSTRDELHRFLLDAGLKSSKTIPSSDLKPAFNLRRSVRKIGDISLSELNDAITALPHERQREFFWDEMLPYLYGHLLQLYGDKQGLEKMGYSKEHIDVQGRYVPVRADGMARLLPGESRHEESQPDMPALQTA